MGWAIAATVFVLVYGSLIAVANDRRTSKRLVASAPTVLAAFFVIYSVLVPAIMGEH